MHETPLKTEQEFLKGQPNVVLVEDDKTLRNMLVYGLSLQGITAFSAMNAAELRDILDKQTINIVVLDIGLPDEDGISVATRLRQTGKYGVIMVTGRDIDIGIIQGAADQYFVKPVNVIELTFAIKNLYKMITERAKESGANKEGKLSEWQYNSKTSSLITPAGVLIKLTRPESAIMYALTKKPGECIPRSELFAALGFVNSQSFDPILENHISTIILKTAKSDPDNPIPIVQRYGQGYVFLQEG